MTTAEMIVQAAMLKSARDWQGLLAHYMGRGHAEDKARELVEKEKMRIEKRIAHEESVRLANERVSQAPIDAESVKEFYAEWRNGRTEVDAWRDYKRRLMAYLLDRAAAEDWLVWRQDIVLYVETPYGQCSFHVVPAGIRRGVVEPPAWFRAVAERNDLRWSGKRDSDIVLRRLRGDKTVGRKIKRPKRLWKRTACSSEQSSRRKAE